ncbi:unnamed protein product [Eruca vesicaria subsp. sativa]|uniref:DUF547 domain-containing protein n=1 Tax=Eruca vesicaria subsp. sativa TaxID=29727 RepID=A0ABC8KMY6_ERUVS|nr:unnamed protein product [Eruca vesicaria subsp. sativa]
MPSNSDLLFFYSSSSSSSQLSTPSACQNGSSRAVTKYPLWDAEKAKCSFGFSKPKYSEELKEEIAELEAEILQLERYLLSLYRTSFGDHLPAFLIHDDSSLPQLPHTTKFHNDRVSYVSDTSLSSSFRPLSESDNKQRSEFSNPSLADLLGLNTLSPNKLSEEIVRLMCVIIIKLSDKGQRRFVKNEKSVEELGVIIKTLCLNEDNLKSVESFLQKFRSLVQKLEKVDPTSMAREEKLAFWINIHNALVMHAYILYGTGEDITSTKAAFNIGGEWVTVYDVQSSILGIRASHSPTPVWTLFSPARSSKTSRSHTYALGYAEPLLHFALSTGTLTDPMVRVYTAEGILQELRQARDSFIQTSVEFEKETRILLPKIIYNYANDTSQDMAELFNTISGCLTETQRTKLKRAMKKTQDRCIHWIKHDSDFRYIIHWEYVRDSLGI